jgi:hypothetical protein
MTLAPRSNRAKTTNDAELDRRCRGRGRSRSEQGIWGRPSADHTPDGSGADQVAARGERPEPGR